MKTKTTLWLFLIGFSMLFASCANQNERVIPANAAMVVKVDLKAIAMKSDLSNQQKEQLSDLFHKEDHELGDLMDNLMENPMCYGINLAKPLYLFVPRIDAEEWEAMVLVSAVVKDQDDLVTALKDLEDEYTEVSIKHKGDYNLVYFNTDLGGIFDDDVVIFGNFKDFEDGSKYAVKLLQQDKEKSFFNSKNAENFKQLEGDVIAYANFAQVDLGENSNEILGYMMRELIGYQAYNYNWETIYSKIKKYSVGCSLQFEDEGVITLSAMVFGDMKDVKMKKVSTDMLDYVPLKDLLGVALLPIDGKAASKVLGQMNSEYSGEYCQMLANIADNMNGTATLAANGYNEENTSAVAILPIKESVIRSEFDSFYGQYDLTYDSWKENFKYYSNSESGSKDNYTYFIYNRSMKTYGSSALKKEQIAKASEYYAYAYLDIPQAIKFCNNIEHANIPSFVSDMFNSLELTMPEQNKASVVLTLNTEDNALAFLLDELIDWAD